MPNQKSDPQETSRLRQKAIARWENEGGARPDKVQGRAPDADPPEGLPLATAEPVQPVARASGSEHPPARRSRS